MSRTEKRYRLRWLDSRNLILCHRMGGQGRDRIFGYYVTVRGAMRSSIKEGLFDSALEFVRSVVFDQPELETEAQRLAGASKQPLAGKPLSEKCTERAAPIYEGSGHVIVRRREAGQ